VNSLVFLFNILEEAFFEMRKEKKKLTAAVAVYAKDRGQGCGVLVAGCFARFG
jgi:hypothetical protein